MIWGSITAMTVIDVLVVAGVCWCLGVFLDSRIRRAATGSPFGTIAVLVGLSVIALHSLANLATMHVLPLIVPMADAMAAMEYLRLDLTGLVTVVAVASLVVGFRSLVKSSVSHVDDLANARSRLESEMKARTRDLEALRKSEEETRKAEARLIDAVNALPIGFTLFDANERVI